MPSQEAQERKWHDNACNPRGQEEEEGVHLECGEHECPSVEVQPISKVKNWIACEKFLHRQEMNEEHPKKGDDSHSPG